MNHRFLLAQLFAGAAVLAAQSVPLRSPVIRGDGAALLHALLQEGNRAAGSWEVTRERQPGGEGCFALYATPEEGPGSGVVRSEAMFLLLAQIGLRLPEDVAVTRLHAEPRRLNLEGEAASFEAANALLSRLQEDSSGLRNADYVGSVILDGERRLYRFVIRATWLGQSPHPEAARQQIAAEAGKKLRAFLPLGQPREPNRLEFVEFTGFARYGGKSLALVRSRNGNVRMLPAGYKFEDAEIQAIDAKGVTLRRWSAPGDPGTVEVRPYASARAVAK